MAQLENLETGVSIKHYGQTRRQTTDGTDLGLAEVIGAAICHTMHTANPVTSLLSGSL